MISYSSSDIIKRSLNLADLTNSSFLIFCEKLQYLNTSWTNIYQKIIDAGEKDWLNTVYLVPGASTSYNGVKYSLPSDFYQIYSVSSFPNNSPILRRAKNEPYTSLRYDVINGELIIYGSIASNLQVQYYPLPQTRTFPAAEKALGVDTTNTYYDCNNDSYLYISWSGGNLTVGYYSLLTGTSTTVATIPDTLNFPYKGLISGKNIMIWNSAL